MTRLASLFQRALDAIRHDCPTAWNELVRTGHALTISFDVDDEHFAVVGTNRGLRVDKALPIGKGVHITTTVQLLRDLIMGETGLVDSIERGEIFVVGSPRDLIAADRMVWLAVAGAARSSSAPTLLDELLA